MKKFKSREQIHLFSNDNITKIIFKLPHILFTIKCLKHIFGFTFFKVTYHIGNICTQKKKAIK